jgi:hypothetical protein
LRRYPPREIEQGVFGILSATETWLVEAKCISSLALITTEPKSCDVATGLTGQAELGSR